MVFDGKAQTWVDVVQLVCIEPRHWRWLLGTKWALADGSLMIVDGNVLNP